MSVKHPKKPNSKRLSPSDSFPQLKRRKRRVKLADVLGSTPLRVYGTFFLTYGALTVFSQLFLFFLKTEVNEAAILRPLICGFVLVAFSIPFFVSGKPLWKIAIDKPFFRFVSFDYFCLPHGSLHTSKGIPLLLSIVFGILFSVFGYFVSPFVSVMSLLGLLILSCAVTAPEMPLFLSILLFPVFALFANGNHVICALLLFCFFAYLRKLLTGRRKADLSLYDLGFFLFGILVLVGGFVTGGDFPVSSLMLFLFLLISPLIGNLLTNSRLLSCAYGSFVVGSFAASILTILRVSFSRSPDYEFRFSFVKSAADALLSATDTHFYSVYLICSIFASLYFLHEKTTKFFFGCNITAMLLALFALSLSLDIFVLLAIVAATLFVFIALAPGRAALLWLIPVLLLPPAVLVLPHFVPVLADRLQGTALDFDVTALPTLLPLLRETFFFGFGQDSAADVASVSLPSLSPGSAYLPMLLSLGVLASGVLLITLLMRPIHMFRFDLKYGSQNRDYAAVCASAATLAVLILGLFRYPFSQLSAFYPFFTVFAIGSVSMTNYAKEVKDRAEASRFQSEATEAVANVYIQKL